MDGFIEKFADLFKEMPENELHEYVAKLKRYWRCTSGGVMTIRKPNAGNPHAYLNVSS